MQLPKSPEAAVQIWSEMTGEDRSDLAVKASSQGVSLEDYCCQSLANHHIGLSCQNFLSTALAVAKPEEQTTEEFEQMAEGVLQALNRTLAHCHLDGNDMAIKMVEESARAALSAIDLCKSENSP